MKKIITATLFITFLTPAYAQVYNCDGVYTNNPCAGQTSATPLPLPKPEADSAAKKAMSRKKSLTHDLAMKVINVNRQHKLTYNTETTEDFCLEEGTSVAECEDRVNEMHDKIDSRVSDLENIKAQKRANELQEKKIKQDAETPDTVIIQQVWVATPTFDPYNPPRWHDRPHWRDKPKKPRVIEEKNKPNPQLGVKKPSKKAKD